MASAERRADSTEGEENRKLRTGREEEENTGRRCSQPAPLFRTCVLCYHMGT